MQLATRPTAGTAGRDINLLVNHFSLGLRINSSLNVYSVSVTDLSHDSKSHNGVPDQQQQQKGGKLPRGLVQMVLQDLAGQAGWPAGWVLVGSDRLASSGSLCEEGSEGPKAFTVKLLPRSEEEPPPAAAAAAAAAAGSSGPLLEDGGSGKGGIFKVRALPLIW
jgi:hypothetical protein